MNRIFLTILLAFNIVFICNAGIMPPSGLEIPEDYVWVTDDNLGYFVVDEELKEVVCFNYITHTSNHPWGYKTYSEVPAKVFHNDVEYTVVGVDYNGFDCAGFVTLPSTILRIGNYCFNLLGDIVAEPIVTFTFPTDLQQIGYNCFNKTKLAVIKFNDRLKEIGGNSFCENKELTTLEFDKTIREIGSNCFKSNPLIKEVYLPNSLYYIGENFFSDCPAIEKVRLPRWLPFTNYHHLISHHTIFNNCPNIRVIEWDCEVPVEFPKSFNAVDKSKCTVIVPDGCKSVYEENNYWKDFIIVEKSQYQASVAELPVDENCEDSYYTLNGFRIHSPENLEKGEIYLKVTDKGTSKLIHR